MSIFVGRGTELAYLNGRLKDVQSSGTGRLLSIRGRRRVGKSRLVAHWCDAVGAQYVFFEASRAPRADELRLFADAVLKSNVQSASSFLGVAFDTWESALSLLIRDATPDKPMIVVLDEFPYLFNHTPHIDATIQTVWDRLIDGKAPVLLMLVGSDLHMMEMLTQYDRPLYGRADEMRVQPLSPAEIAHMTGLRGAAALDAYLTCGGFPALAERWQPGEDMWSYLERELTATSALLVNGERMLTAEFPSTASPRLILDAIGHGEMTFTNISRAAGINQAGTHESLKMLLEKQVIGVMRPMGAVAGSSNLTRYFVADSYLRFWLYFLQRYFSEIERGRPDIALEAIRAAWTSYRGTAIEPIVRASVERLILGTSLKNARYVGSYWTRTNQPQVDLVGAKFPDSSKNKRVELVGSIKWRDNGVFDRSDFGVLQRDGTQVPGFDGSTALIGVSRMGFASDLPLALALGPDDLITAWQ